MNGQGRREFGDSGETIAARYVEDLGWRILGRNVRMGKGELDITAMDGDELVVLEVRARRVGKLMPAEASVGPLKLRTLIKTARKYVEKISFDGCWRIDVIAVTEDESGNIGIELFRDVTMGMGGPFMG
jgi:putative endonuclease